jgi:hypothetical protein
MSLKSWGRAFIIPRTFDSRAFKQVWRDRCRYLGVDPLEGLAGKVDGRQQARIDWLRSSFGRCVLAADAETRRKQAEAGEWWRERPEALLDYGTEDSSAEAMALNKIYDEIYQPEATESVVTINWIEVAAEIKQAVQQEREAAPDVTLRQIEAWQFYRAGVKKLEAHKRAIGLGLEQSFLTSMI